MDTLRTLFRQDDIPRGVRVLTWATSIRWLGWGFAESLIPIFLFMFAKSYAETGLLKSAYDIVLIIALPVMGVLADRMRATTLVLVGLAMYIFVGAGYWLAGVTGMVIFIVIARMFNGLGYAMDAVGRETYFRRHTPTKNLATAFGYFDSLADFCWIAASLLGIILIKFFSIGTLLFLITPTVIIAMAVLVWFRRTEPNEKISEEKQKAVSRNLLLEFAGWDRKLKLVTFLNFWISFASGVVAFFLPIQVYTEGAGYVPVIIMGVIMTIPSVMGWGLGKVFDRKGIRIFGYGLSAMAALLLGLAFAKSYLLQIVIGFVFGIIIELLWVGSEELMTIYADPDHFGRVDGIARSIDDMGALAGPLAAGIVIDAFGTATVYVVLAGIMIVLAGCFMLAMRYARRRA